MFWVDVLLVVLLFTTTNAQCPRYARHLSRTLEGRECQPACLTNSYCVGSNRCLCDGICGYSCINPDSFCPEPKAIRHGSYERTKLKVGGRVHYSCDDGYVMVGKSSRNCTPGRKWAFSDNLPFCRPMRELQPVVTECILNLPEVFVPFDPRTRWTKGDTLTLKCDGDFKLIRKKEQLTCLSNGSWSGTFPECSYIPPSHTYVANGYEYVAFTDIKVNKEQAVEYCNEMEGWSLLIAHGQIHRENVMEFLEVVGISENEYWLDLTYVGGHFVDGFFFDWLEGGKWTWYDGHVSTVQDSPWRDYDDKPRDKCPVIGRNLCGGSGKYCWQSKPCDQIKTLTCQRGLNQVRQECIFNLPERFVPLRRRFFEGETLALKCKDDSKEIRGYAHIHCLPNGRLTWPLPECINIRPSRTHVANGIEYLAFNDIKLNKEEASEFCRGFGGSLLIAHRQNHRENVMDFLDVVGVSENEYWLDLTYVGGNLQCGRYQLCRYSGGKWTWVDGHRIYNGMWANQDDSPHSSRIVCSVIGSNFCSGSGKYCWGVRNCDATKPLTCQRADNPCNYSPCHHMGTCIADPEESLGYRCICNPAFFGVNCSNEMTNSE